MAKTQQLPSGGRWAAAVFLGFILLAGAAPAAAAGAPSLEAVWPQNAAVGSLVTVRGEGFRSDAENNLVRFGALPARVVAVSGDELIVEVPPATDTVGVTVEVRGRRSDPLPYSIRPSVLLDVPELGRGQSAQLTMTVLGTDRPAPVEVFSLDPTAARLDGEVYREEASSGGASNRAALTLERISEGSPRLAARPIVDRAEIPCLGRTGADRPEIWDVRPTDPSPGEPLVIRGRGLRSPFGDTTATIGGDHEMTVLDATETTVIAVVPEGATDGEVVVSSTGEDGETVASDPFPTRLQASLRLAADRVDLAKGEQAVVTATLVGTAEPTAIDVVMLTPRVATLSDGGAFIRVETGGGEPNQARFTVKARSAGSFSLRATVHAEPEDPATARTDADQLELAAGATGELATSEVDQAGRSRPVPSYEIAWTVMPDGLGTVTEAGAFQAGDRPGCGVLIGELPGVAPFIVAVEVAGGPVFQDDGCTWRRICVDVYVMARPGPDGKVSVGPAYVEAPAIVGTKSVPRAVEIPAAAFTLAGGAIADLERIAAARPLLDNLRQMLGETNKIYAPCCIWFSLGRVYAIDPARARVSADGSKLDRWLRTDDDGEVVVDGTLDLQLAEGERSIMGAMKYFVKNESRLPENPRCLKALIARNFKGEEGEPGRAIKKGDYAAWSQDSLNTKPSPNWNQPKGFVPGHELGHCLGMEHVDDSADPGEARLMQKRVPRHTQEITVLEENCERAQPRARELGTEAEPPRERPAPGGEPGGGRSGGAEGSATPAPEPGGDPRRDRGDETGEEEADEDEQDTEEDEEGCRCPNPEVRTSGEEALNNLIRGESATGTATFAACCADVVLSVEVEKLRDGKFNVSWSFDLIKKDPDCFVSFELDRYYNSKQFQLWMRGASPSRAVQVKKLRFVAAGDDRFRLDGKGGFELNLGEGMILDRDQDASLNVQKRVKEWRLILGGVIVCKDRDGERRMPFQVEFSRDDEGRIRLTASPTRSSDESPPRGLVTESLARID